MVPEVKQVEARPRAVAVDAIDQGEIGALAT